MDPPHVSDPAQRPRPVSVGHVRGRKLTRISFGRAQQVEQRIGAVGLGRKRAAADRGAPDDPGDACGCGDETTAREDGRGGMRHSDILPGVGDDDGQAVQ